MKRTIKISFVAMMAVGTLSFGGGEVSFTDEPVIAVEEVEDSATSFYVGAGFNRGVYSGNVCPSCSYEDTTYGVTLRAGYDFNKYLGVEARYVGTFWNADEFAGQEFTHVGLYAKPVLPASERFNIYGLAGYGLTQTSTTAGGGLAEVDENGFAAGIGLEYDMDTHDKDGAVESGVGLFVDYQRLLIASDVPDMDVVSAGATFDF